MIDCIEVDLVLIIAIYSLRYSGFSCGSSRHEFNCNILLIIVVVICCAYFIPQQYFIASLRLFCCFIVYLTIAASALNTVITSLRCFKFALYMRMRFVSQLVSIKR